MHLSLQRRFAWWQRYIAVTFGSTSVLSIFLLYTAMFSDQIPRFIALIFYALTCYCFSHITIATLAGNIVFNECCRVRLNVIKLSVAVLGKRRSLLVGGLRNASLVTVQKFLDQEVSRGHYSLGCNAYGMYHMTRENYMQVLLSVACYFLLVASKF